MDIPPELLDVGPWGLFLLLVFLVVRAVVKGDLVPRQTYQDILTDRDQWRSAHQTSEQARQEERQQKRELLEYAKLGTHVVSSLPKVEDGEP